MVQNFYMSQNIENIFKEMLLRKMDRRDFLKTGTIALLPLVLKFNLFNKENPDNRITCKNCGAINKDMRVYFFDWLIKDPVKYCYNCGIDLEKRKYKVIYSERHKHIVKTKRVDRGQYASPVYYQIPFPNHKFLVKTNKPDFRISDIKF